MLSGPRLRTPEPPTAPQAYLAPYLENLDRELARHLPPDDVRARVAEIEAHLRDSTEGRVELGLDRETAEREAVEAFGEARRLGQSLADEALVSRNNARLSWLGATFGLLILYVVLRSPLGLISPLAPVVILVGVAFGVVGFAWAGFRARRPAPVPVVATGLGATLVLCALLSGLWLDLGAFRGVGIVTPFDAERSPANLAKRLAEIRASQAALDGGNAVLNGPAGIEAFRSVAGYRAPVIRSWYAGSDPLRFAAVPTAEAATKAWAEATRSMKRFDDRRLKADLDAIEAASTHPMQNALAIAPEAGSYGIAAASFAALIDLAAGGLGLAWVRRRKPGSGGALRA